MELDFGEYEAGYPLYNERVQDLYLENGAKYGIEFPAIGLNALNDPVTAQPVECMRKRRIRDAAQKSPELTVTQRIGVGQFTDDPGMPFG